MAIPHMDKILAVWLAEPQYVSLSGTDITTWTDLVSGIEMITEGTNYPQWDGDSVYVDDEALVITPVEDRPNEDRVFMKLLPVNLIKTATVFWGGGLGGLRLSVNLNYRIMSDSDSNDYSYSTGRTWVNGAISDSFSGNHVVSVENGRSLSKPSLFSGLKSGYGTRHPGTKYQAIICTRPVTDQEGDNITEWLMRYVPGTYNSELLGDMYRSNRIGQRGAVMNTLGNRMAQRGANL